jgi:hypothetical protein
LTTRPPRIAEGWQALIVRLRHCRMTAEEIASRVRLARSTVAGEFVRICLNRLSALAPKWRRAAPSGPRPGDLVHLDIKKLARFDKPGHRVTRTRRGPNDGVG